MSYILEALKRSEQERNRNGVLALRTARESTWRCRSNWLRALTGVGMLSLLASGAWLLESNWFQIGSTSGVPFTENARAPQAGASSATRSAEDQATVQSLAPSSAERGRGGSLSGMTDNARARVQGLSVDAVFYSAAPERRFVMLNQRIVRESESVADGVVLKRILPNGALLSVGEYEILLKPE